MRTLFHNIIGNVTYVSLTEFTYKTFILRFLDSLMPLVTAYFANISTSMYTIIFAVLILSCGDITTILQTNNVHPNNKLYLQ